MSSGRTPGSSGSGSSSPATVTGTPAAVSARRSAGTCRCAERTSTAIRSHGTPSARCARRSVSATTAASCAWVSATQILTCPAGPPCAGTQLAVRGGVAAPSAAGRGGSRRATRRDAASSTGPLRRQVRSATTGAGAPSGPRNLSGSW